MLIPNGYLRMGCSAVLLSNRRRGEVQGAFRSIYQEEDGRKCKGMKISRDMIEIGGKAIKANVTTLGPLVLPFSEQLIFFATLLWKLISSNGTNSRPANPYIPDYEQAFKHSCLHAASRTVLDELQRNLELSDKNMEASHATLHRFGNTSSSSIWYELAYLEAKGQIKRGNHIWQIAFWKSRCRITRPSRNPWLD